MEAIGWRACGLEGANTFCTDDGRRRLRIEPWTASAVYRVATTRTRIAP